MNYTAITEVQSIFRRVKNPELLGEFRGELQFLTEATNTIARDIREDLEFNGLISGAIRPVMQQSDNDCDAIGNRWEALLNSVKAKVETEQIELYPEPDQKIFSILS